MCNSNILLIEIECKHCKTQFYMCRSCYNGHEYCSSECRLESNVQAHRKSQSKYRKSDKGRKKNRISEQNRRRIGKKEENKKTMADRTTNPPIVRVIKYPIMKNKEPRCSFCGALGKVVDVFPTRYRQNI